MDFTPTLQFSTCEQEFQELLSGIRQKLESRDELNYGQEQRKAGLRRVELELDEADELVSQMEFELQGVPISIRPSYQSRVKGAKAELRHFKKLSRDVHAQVARSELLARLGDQMEQIQNSKDAQRADTNVDRPSAALKKMIRRIHQQHAITGAIVVVLGIIAIPIFYFKVVR